MISIPSLLRQAEHKALSTVTLSGSVLDLGGAKNAEYLSYIHGTFTTTVVNMDLGTSPDIIHDLEKPLPLEDSQFDHVLAMNVFEHVFAYRELLTEAVRVLKREGSLTIVVPFLFPVHPDPYDYWRFSHMTLRREFEATGLADIRIEPLGSGVFAARYVMLDRLLPGPIRIISFYTMRYLAAFLDSVFVNLARRGEKKYLPSDYALGYLVTARKPT